MSAFLTAIAFPVLVVVAAYVLHLLGLQHAGRIGPAARPRPHRRLGPGPVDRGV
ncbi:hypothetical protein [Streptomyces sp. NPDC001781]